MVTVCLTKHTLQTLPLDVEVKSHCWLIDLLDESDVFFISTYSLYSRNWLWKKWEKSSEDQFHFQVYFFYMVINTYTLSFFFFFKYLFKNPSNFKTTRNKVYFSLSSCNRNFVKRVSLLIFLSWFEAINLLIQSLINKKFDLMNVQFYLI